jgi:hypothetical protein
MQLALFTPGAYVWPLHRNFESFIAALATRSDNASNISKSRLYPVKSSPDRLALGITHAVDERLTTLHRELYSAMLRPSSYWKGDERLFVDAFWPDLRHSAADYLFEALSFYFTGRRLHEIDVLRGLALIRAVFFNHEAADPELWLDATRRRLSTDRNDFPQHRGVLIAPPTVRLDNLAFCIHSSTTRPALSSGWVRGEIRRQHTGHLMVQYVCGLEPGVESTGINPTTLSALEADVAFHLRCVFGWQEAIAA